MPFSALSSHHSLPSLATVMLYALVALIVGTSLGAMLTVLFISLPATKAWLTLLFFCEVCVVFWCAFDFLSWLAWSSLALVVKFAGLLAFVSGTVFLLVVRTIQFFCQLPLACAHCVTALLAPRSNQSGTNWTRLSASRLAWGMNMTDNVFTGISSQLSDSVGLRRRHNRRRPFASFVADSMATSVSSVASLASRLGRCTLESVDSLPRLVTASFPTFSYIKRLGSGSFGNVFLARTVGHFSELKAVKVMAKTFDTPVELLRNEAHVHAFLSRSYGGLCHPNIVRLDSVKEDGANISMMMEYCSGGTLKDLYCRTPRTTASDAAVASALLPVAHAVAHMHRHGIGHRDIKMENILVDGQGTLKLADFGIATRDQVSREFCGTPTTIAPEVFSLDHHGHPYSPRPVDVWALGVIFWHLKFKSLPWDEADDYNSPDFRSYIRSPYSFLDRQEGMTAATASLALRLLHPDPTMRATADEAVQILQAMAQ